MLTRRFEKLLIRPEDLSPSRDDFEVIGALNPAVAEVGDDTVLLVRVAERPRERRPGWTPLPYWQTGVGLAIDWRRDDTLRWLDPRMVQRKEDGLVRLTFISHLRVLRSRSGTAIDLWDGARFEPELPWEGFGVEDPRISRIDGRWYFTYVAVSPAGVATALASTADFTSFRRHGIIFCPENKDVVLFPETIQGHYWALHRPNAATPFSTPEMWLARSDDLVHWGDHQRLWGGTRSWEGDRVGAGPPPLKTNDGWLVVYHGSQAGSEPGQVGTYSAGAVLLDLEDPSSVPSSNKLLLAPETDFERHGFVPNVVFPTGAIRHGDGLRLYYGAADTCTAVAEIGLNDVLAALQEG